MKNIFRLSAMLTALCMLLSACSAPTENPSETNVPSGLEGKPIIVGDIPCEFPLVEGDTSLNIIITGYENIKSEDVFVWNEYEKMTGVMTNWTTVTKDERAEKVYNALVNKQDIDLIMRCKISPRKLTQYGESGLILDLAKDDMLEKNAPNCWAYLQSHPDALAAVTNPDGTIYSLPQVNSGAELRVSRKIFVNKTWLEKVNMELPKTTEEFYQLLKAFKEQDANGNGDPNDEIPFSPFDWASVQDSLFGSFGLADRGCHNQVVDCDENTGKARLIATSDEYKSYLQYLNKLYSEGLLDKYVFTIKKDQWVTNIQNDKIGVFASTNLATLPSDKMDNWVTIDEALEGPNGDKLFSAVRANLQSAGAAVIPSTCDNPELVLRWLDYFWTDEGTLFYHMGVENKTFEVNDDGSYDYMPYVYEQMKTENISFDDAVARISPYPGGSNPTVEIAPYFMGGEMADVPAAAARKLFEYGPKEYWPIFTFTSDENDRLESVQSDILKYTESSQIEFISGTKSFSDWDDYLKQVDNLGKDELVEIYQAAVDRYHALVNKE